MPLSSPLFPRSGTRTFRAACAVLAAVAVAQGLALGMVWKENRNRPGSSAGQQSPAHPDKISAGLPPRGISAPAVVLPPKPAGPSVEEPGPDPFASPAPLAEESGAVASAVSQRAMPVPSRTGEARTETSVSSAPPAEPVIARPSVKVKAAAPLDTPITDEECLRHLDEGIYLRGRGEMQGALTELRGALARDPDHPQLLYQLARTLDMMLQERKSVVIWEKLRLLGPGAGNSYQLAISRLRELSGVTPAVDEEEEKGGRFELGNVTVERLADTSNGEILRFHTSVKRLQADVVDVAKIWIKLHLFDMVNGQRIERTTAVPAVPQWLDQPVDWADGVERFDFEYRQAPLSADEIVKLGQRKYYGYAVELRYGAEHQEKFEDMAAEPRELANFAREIPEEGPAPAEPAMAPSRGNRKNAPDGTLFPGDRYDR